MRSRLPSSSRGTEPWTTITRARPLLGTLVQIRASAPRDLIHPAIDAAFAAIERVYRLLSYHCADSELSALNQLQPDQPLRVHADTYAVLGHALAMARLSDGAFDPCTGAELERWGLLPVRTSSASPGGWRDIELLPGQRVLLHRPVRIDVGGIAKGYAVDLAVDTLMANGARGVLVNAGGDLRLCGPQAQQISLRNPLSPGLAGETLLLRNAALATSAAYFSREPRGPEEVSALVHPLDREPYLGGKSVSVHAARCVEADALTKVVLFAAAEVAERALAACNAIAYIQCPDDGMQAHDVLRQRHSMSAVVHAP